LVAEELERTEQERDREELVKLAFETCKHLTTLSTAGTLVVLAVYREVSFGGTPLGATLGLFGLTIIVSIAVMLLSMTYYTNKGRRDRAAVDPLLM
jgi:multidrug efflux pump subunit AcrB